MRSSSQSSVLVSPLGPLVVDWQGQVVVGLRLPLGDAQAQLPTVAAPDWLERAVQGYFYDPRQPFDLSLELSGTAFQQRVWQLLRRIPCGTVRRYGELAAELGSSARAVGNACRANPCPILVPCHRVVASAGLGGFVGQTQGASLNLKTWLLRHEGVNLAEFGG
ncbi:methylated-DNA--[protein]-cysteine S-methyltransferase [Thiorhodovibrio winogradskyi]|uniref:methylated-DNA--[protein]-cysteine S-methyltransferase n=1 Tax=Thiorhodovibrio winogradskyi TaxID=77007 RepID=UPI002E28013A|nr:methylated-DNA--[protein]-cysteine S-methyltransferase [Thiorhodovibrio winogradskyi]